MRMLFVHQDEQNYIGFKPIQLLYGVQVNGSACQAPAGLLIRQCEACEQTLSIGGLSPCFH